VVPEEKGILLLYKPRAVVTTLSDPEGRRTIADWLTKNYKSYFPVGRLDYDSSGLVILTNDGELAQRLMHPRYELPRVYKAKVEGIVSEETVAKFPQGIRLDDGMAKGFAKILSAEGKYTWLEIEVREGRNHLVRRMCDKVGHHVDTLVRISHGPFKLHRMKPGEVNKLSEREYLYFRRKVMDVEAVQPGVSRQVTGADTSPESRPIRRSPTGEVLTASDAGRAVRVAGRPTGRKPRGGGFRKSSGRPARGKAARSGMRGGARRSSRGGFRK
jgi:23S rRNA pseudouridine2605 synthase